MVATHDLLCGLHRPSHQTSALADRVSPPLHSPSAWQAVPKSLGPCMGTQLGGWRGTGLAPVRLALAIQRGASGKAAPRVRLSKEGAHQWTLHGWLTVCPWQLVICHCWTEISGGNVINFALPFSEISSINHPKLGLCEGFRCPSDKSLPVPSAPRLVSPLRLQQKKVCVK